MIEIQIPGRELLIMRHLVLDYNGTIAKDGLLLPELTAILKELAECVEIHVITADTFGSVAKELAQIPLKLAVLSHTSQDQGKLNYINELGPEHTVAIGNGRNDCLMVQAAALGIAVIQEEGAWAKTILAADIVCNNIVSALELLKHPLRLKATLRI